MVDSVVKNNKKGNLFRSVLKIFKPTKNGIHIELSLLMPSTETYRLYLVSGHKSFECKFMYVLNSGKKKNNDEIEKLYFIDVLYSDLKKNIEFVVKKKNYVKKLERVSLGKYVPFSSKLDLFIKFEDKLFYVDCEYRRKQFENISNQAFCIVIEKYSKKAERMLINRRTRSLLKFGIAGIKSILIRPIISFVNSKKEKSIWLVSDRTNKADDNGEVFFRYLRDNKRGDITPYFVIDKNTDVYKSLRSIGKVISPFSLKHKFLFLLSEYVISSQANAPVINPFRSIDFLYRDLMYDKKIIFLQHGVTKDNQSSWLNKYNRNLTGLVVNTKAEYESMFTYDYYYSKNDIWLLGMPRFDKLRHDEKSYVTIMPTWRKYLSSGANYKGIWKISGKFIESEYFNFYRDLINNERLLAAADLYGYTICFMPHPNIMECLDYFKKDDRVLFMDSSYAYSDVFAWTNLLITDYSSVAFDFAYLRKPVIYAQFDKEQFFAGDHSYTKGYFEYERDGFGEVEYTLDSVVDEIIKYMKNDCKLKGKYKKRIEEAFTFDDANCSKRVYEKILSYRDNK